MDKGMALNNAWMSCRDASCTRSGNCRLVDFATSPELVDFAIESMPPSLPPRNCFVRCFNLMIICTGGRGAGGRGRGRSSQSPEQERLLEAFADTDSGEPRASAEAVERAAQRAIKRSIDALPDDHEQHGGLHVGGVQQGELDARSVEGLLREAHLHAPPVEWAVRELEAWAGGICAERGTGAGGSPAAAHLKVARLHASQLRRAQVPEGQH